MRASLDELLRCAALPAFSAAKSGPRWRWFVWANYAAQFDGAAPIASGIATSPAECEAVRAAHGAHDWRPALARAWIKRQAAEQRQRRAESCNGGECGATVPAFLYTWWQLEDGSEIWAAHRIAKRTPRFVFVECEPWRDSRARRPAEWYDYAAACYRLPADVLERDGRAFATGRAQFFYTEAGREQRERERRKIEAPQCLTALGLDQTATARDVKRAYRRLSRETHPDAGGEAAAFVTLTEHYEQALAWAKKWTQAA